MKKKKNKKVSWFGKIFDYKMFFYDFVKWTGALPLLIFLRLKVIYVSKEAKKFKRQEGLIIANHNTFIDPLILNNLTWYRRNLCVTSEGIFNNSKFKKRLFLSFKCIPIDKENISVSTFKQVAREIKYGHFVSIFPEGAVKLQDDISQFKNGAIMMALFAKTSIIPVYIKVRTSIWQRQKVIVGDRIDVKNYFSSSVPTIEEMDKASELLRQEELKLKEIADKIR